MADWTPLGIGAATMLVPDGWTAVSVDAGAVGLESGALAAGVAQDGSAPVGSNVLLYRTGDGEDLPPGWGEGVAVLHDGPGPRGVRRVQLRFVEVMGLAFTQLLCWFTLGGERLLVVGMWESARMSEVGDVVTQVVQSVLPAPGTDGAADE
jgi:hypothetical protein